MSRATTMKKLSGTALAIAAAGLFVGQTVLPAAAADDAKIHCGGVNACKGKSDCKTAKSECKGQNACKGQGYKAMSAKDCKAKGGTEMKS